MFVILSGSSGVGKNTIIKKLEMDIPKYRLMPTFTTRQKRESEIEGYPFYFLTKEEFQEKIKNNEFIEYESIHNNFYGSTYKIFDEQLKSGKILIKDIGVDGAQNLSDKLKDKTKTVKLFLTTESKGVLKHRLKGRKEKHIRLRLKRFGYEQKQKNKFDWIILNNNLQETCEIIDLIIGFENKDFLPTKKVKKINFKLVKRCFEKLKCGKILKPIQVCLNSKKPYIVKGIESFVASLLAKKNVAKLIVKKKRVKKLDVFDYKDFQELIKKEI